MIGCPKMLHSIEMHLCAPRARRLVLYALLAALFGVGAPANAEEGEVSVEPSASLAEMSLEEVDQQLNNPLTSLWSATLQANFSLLSGDRIKDQETASTIFFQPAFPIPVGRDKVFIARPVFPWVTRPILEADGSSGDDKSGLGDIQLMTLVGPDKAKGLTWGIGATFVTPTADHDVLGAGKWQAGPAAMVLNLGEKWTTGFVAQHWWSFAGDDNRASANHTDFQYIMRRKIPGAMSIGMGPTISIDWTADSDERVTLPDWAGNHENGSHWKDATEAEVRTPVFYCASRRSGNRMEFQISDHSGHSIALRQVRTWSLVCF